MDNETIAFAGLVLILVGIIGNRKIKIKDVEIGNLSNVQRFIVVFLGVFVITGSFWPSFLVLIPPSSTPIPTPTSTPSLTINISNPLNGDEVAYSIVVQGIIFGELPKDHYMWVVVHPHDDIGWYPQVGRVVPFDGKWSASAWIGLEGSVDLGKGFDILVVLVTKESDQYYLNYLEQSSKTGNYPGIAIPKDAIVYDSIKVIRM